jgi:hypothetical protein
MNLPDYHGEEPEEVMIVYNTKFDKEKKLSKNVEFFNQKLV